MSKKVLGRGLAALLSDAKNDINSASDEGASKIVGKTAEIDIQTISANPFQPRTQFSEEHLEELAASIRQFGVIQPITVRKTGFNSFQLISGERRFRAARLAGLTHIPAYIRLANDQEMLEMALIENIQRRDLDPIEVATSFRQLIDSCHLTQEQMSERVGKKRSTITNYLRLLRLEPVIQAGMRDGILSMGHGRALINVDDPDAQMRIYQKIVEGSLSVRQTEKGLPGRPPGRQKARGTEGRRHGAAAGVGRGSKKPGRDPPSQDRRPGKRQRTRAHRHPVFFPGRFRTLEKSAGKKLNLPHAWP